MHFAEMFIAGRARWHERLWRAYDMSREMLADIFDGDASLLCRKALLLKAIIYSFYHTPVDCRCTECAFVITSHFRRACGSSARYADDDYWPGGGMMRQSFDEPTMLWNYAAHTAMLF